MVLSIKLPMLWLSVSFLLGFILPEARDDHLHQYFASTIFTHTYSASQNQGCKAVVSSTAGLMYARAFHISYCTHVNHSSTSQKATPIIIYPKLQFTLMENCVKFQSRESLLSLFAFDEIFLLFEKYYAGYFFLFYYPLSRDGEYKN